MRQGRNMVPVLLLGYVDDSEGFWGDVSNVCNKPELIEEGRPSMQLGQATDGGSELALPMHQFFRIVVHVD